jgi:hypothetical protein
MDMTEAAFNRSAAGKPRLVTRPADGSRTKALYDDARAPSNPEPAELVQRMQFRRVLLQFVQAVKDYSYVQWVFYEGDAPVHTRIWTVISAPEFDAGYRRPIYSAQVEALKKADEPVVDFRLINLRELEGDLEEVLPARRTELYSR